MIIGISATICAGKGTIAEYLRSKGFIPLSLSDEIREEMKMRGIELTRDNIRAWGNKIREEEGNNALARRALRRLEPGKDYAIESIRNPAEVLELKKHPQFVLIAVDAPARLRFQRALERDRERDPKTFEEFLKNDLLEEGRDEHGNERKDSNQRIGECLAMADFSIYNDSDIGTLSERINEIIDETKNR